MLVLALIVAGVMVVLWFVVVPIFERLAPIEVVRAYQRLTMPLFRGLYGFAPGFGVVETIGRRSGRPYRVPVGGRISEGAFWFVAGAGRRTHYVRNIEANPRVRVKTLGRWHAGTAYLCPADDARRRAIKVSPLNGIFLLLANKAPLALRIELDD